MGGKEMEIEDKLKDIINIILEKNEKERIEVLNDNLSLRNDLEMDSLDLAEFTVRIEDEFGVDVFEDGIVDTIKEVIDKIEKR
jgi:acyl carrier protein